MFRVFTMRSSPSAEAELGRAREALDAKDAPLATERFQLALAALERADAAEQLFEQNRQRPPVLVSRRPRRELVEVGRNRSVSLAVEAQDPNRDDTLGYTWSFEGEALDAMGAELELHAERSGTLDVLVADGRGGEVSASWRIEVLNSEPTLSLAPDASPLILVVGYPQTLEARVSDPDGDPVSTIFRIDGQEVFEGRAYDFAPESPGTHQLEVVATDAGGAEVVLTRRIEVVLPEVGAEPPRLPFESAEPAVCLRRRRRGWLSAALPFLC